MKTLLSSCMQKLYKSKMVGLKIFLKFTFHTFKPIPLNKKARFLELIRKRLDLIFRIKAITVFKSFFALISIRYRGLEI
jgi:hypothetical protein